MTLWLFLLYIKMYLLTPFELEKLKGAVICKVLFWAQARTNVHAWNTIFIIKAPPTIQYGWGSIVWTNPHHLAEIQTPKTHVQIFPCVQRSIWRRNLPYYLQQYGISRQPKNSMSWDKVQRSNCCGRFVLYQEDESGSVIFGEVEDSSNGWRCYLKQHFNCKCMEKILIKAHCPLTPK